MTELWRPFHELLPEGLAIGALLLGILVVWRRLGEAGRRYTAWIFCIAWAMVTLLVTLRPQPAMIDANGVFRSRQLQLLPFKDLRDVVVGSATWHTLVEQVVGNLVLFAPLGVGIALVTLGGRPHWSAGLAYGAAAGTVIESTQWILGTGRVSSIDDIFLAALGTGLAFGGTRTILKRKSPQPELASETL